MTKHKNDDVLVVGETLIDAIATPDGLTTEHPGGSPANVAVALARLGRKVRFATAFGADARGDVLASHLLGAGIDFEGDPRILDHTSVATALIGPSGSANYHFDLEWRLGAVEVGTPRFIHVGSIGATLRPGSDRVLTILDAAPHSTLISYDINARPAITGTGRDVVHRIEELAARADLVKASDEDLDALFPELDVNTAARHLLALGPRAVVITRGGDGASWFDSHGRVDALSERVRVVDTIGAGDTFSAALIDALWSDVDADPAGVLHHAIRAAAVTVSRAGANPPYRRELER